MAHPADCRSDHRSGVGVSVRAPPAPSRRSVGDLTLFGRRAFTTAIISMLLVTVLGSLMFFTAQYLQLVAGLTPLQSGFALLPAAAVSIVSVTISPVLARHVRPAYVIAVGMLVSALGAWLFTLPDNDSGVVPVRR
jgi:MFS transporter, DHA2 family, multidrug resistance protein